jgi:hypothetical protein
MSEGGDTVWVNRPQQETYWGDGSYIELSSPIGATKVWYGPGPANDHSAITTPTVDRFISKFGEGPIFRHEPQDCPWSESADLHYYVLRPTITGLDVVCPSSGIEFTLNNPPTNFTIAWSSNPIPEDDDYSLDTNGNECTITNNNHVGEITLTATIFNDYDTIIVSKEILLTYSPNYYTFYAELTTGGSTDWLQDCNGHVQRRDRNF